MPTNSNESGILAIKEIAECLKVTERTIYRRAADIDGWIATQSKPSETK
jgi:transcriptional antiterminator